jgi:adenosylmethionine-8-amino-7-oxononanoate aminotransferase
MTSFLVLGTDTDAGKTAFCLLWQAAFPTEYAYWKPVETGDSDSDRLAALVPEAEVLPSLARFTKAVAPPLAARCENRSIPLAGEIARCRPAAHRPLIIETFGSPFSPLNETELQLALVQAFELPVVVVTPSTVGAIGRILQALTALRMHGARVAAVILLGGPDSYAEEQLLLHGGSVRVVSLAFPAQWDRDGIWAAARRQSQQLQAIRQTLADLSPPSSAAELLARDRAVVWHPYTSLDDPAPPLPVVGAQDEFLELADGRRLIDAISSWWTTLHGHRHPPLVEAFQAGLRRFDHVLFAGVTHEPAVALAELLLQSLAWNAGRVFYSDDGSTAVEVALKLAYQYWCHRGAPGRTLYVGFENGYHGDTFGAMAVARDPVFFGRFEPLLFRCLQSPVLPESLDALLNQHQGEVAAIIIEPLVQGAGGMRFHSPETLRSLCDVAHKHNVLVIADEVMTGGGRTGTIWAHQQARVTPDLICAGKTLTGGMMPLAATLVAPNVVEAFQTPDRTKTFFHGHSYTAHPLACSVAAANWELMIQGEWRSNVNRIEACWNAWAQTMTGRPGIKDVRVCGTILAFDLIGQPGYLSELGPRIRAFAIERGVLLRPLGNVVYAMPPLCTSDASLARITATMEALIAELV